MFKAAVLSILFLFLENSFAIMCFGYPGRYSGGYTGLQTGALHLNNNARVKRTINYYSHHKKLGVDFGIFMGYGTACRGTSYRGIEFSLNYPNLSSSRNDRLAQGNTFTHEYDAGLKFRIGNVINGALLVYLSLGGKMGRFQNKFFVTNPSTEQRQEKTKYGASIGLGIEKAFASKISFRAEGSFDMYQHYKTRDLDSTITVATIKNDVKIGRFSIGFIRHFT